MPMRDYENIKDITIPPEQEAIMNIVCDTWEECRELECTNCPDRPKKFMSLMECFALKFTRKLIEAGYAPVVRCKDCKRSGMYDFGCGDRVHLACLEIEEDGFVRMATAVNDNDYCSRGESREE